jgi:heme A synthase
MMATQSQPRSLSFQWFSRLVVFVAVLLVWWGAATTTKQAGMVFADWPLSLGTVNPPGWLEHMVPFLEHSHRLLAKLVGILVLALFAWAYVRTRQQALEVVGLVLLLAVVLGVFIAAGSERFDADLKRRLLLTALGLSVLPIAWLAWLVTTAVRRAPSSACSMSRLELARLVLKTSTARAISPT